MVQNWKKGRKEYLKSTQLNELASAITEEKILVENEDEKEQKAKAKVESIEVLELPSLDFEKDSETTKIDRSSVIRSETKTYTKRFLHHVKSTKKYASEICDEEVEESKFVYLSLI